MDASLRLRFVQHDKPVRSFQAFLLCHSERSEESTHGCFASLSMTRPKMSFRAFLLCHSKRQRGIHSWMLRFAQHDKTEDVIPSISFVSFRAPARNPLMDASLRWRSVQRDKPVQSFQAFLLCHSERSEESTHGCFASFSMTRPKMSFRASARNPAHGCFASLSMTNWWMLPSCSMTG